MDETLYSWNGTGEDPLGSPERLESVGDVFESYWEEVLLPVVLGPCQQPPPPSLQQHAALPFAPRAAQVVQAARIPHQQSPSSTFQQHASLSPATQTSWSPQQQVTAHLAVPQTLENFRQQSPQLQIQQDAAFSAAQQVTQASYEQSPARDFQQYAAFSPASQAAQALRQNLTPSPCHETPPMDFYEHYQQVVQGNYQSVPANLVPQPQYNFPPTSRQYYNSSISPYAAFNQSQLPSPPDSTCNIVHQPLFARSTQLPYAPPSQHFSSPHHQPFDSPPSQAAYTPAHRSATAYAAPVSFARPVTPSMERAKHPQTIANKQRLSSEKAKATRQRVALRAE